MEDSWHGVECSGKRKKLKPECETKEIEELNALFEVPFRGYETIPPSLRSLYEKVANDPYAVNELLLFFYAFSEARHNIPLMVLYEKIERVELASMAKCKGQSLSEVMERHSVQMHEELNVALLESPILDVYQSRHTFVYIPSSFVPGLKQRQITFEEEALPMAPYSSSIVEKSEFIENFSLFTNNQFRDWDDWNNMCVIGGSMVACLSTCAETLGASLNEDRFEKKRKYFQDGPFRDADIDIYFYGLTQEEFRQKVIRLYHHLKRVNADVVAVKTPFTITFLSPFPNRPIQIVLGQFNSMADILMEADVDCTCVAFDGDKPWTTQRGRLGYNLRQTNVSDRAYKLRETPEYESRLVKYSWRGFTIHDPKLDWSRVSEQYLNTAKARLKSKPDPVLADVYGLRLLLTGLKWNEIREVVPLFNRSKESTLPYGPNFCTIEAIEKKIGEGIMKLSAYGFQEIDNDSYHLLTSVERGLVIDSLQPLDAPNWRSKHDWYSRCFTDQYEAEEKMKALERRRGGYYVLFGSHTICVQYQLREENETTRDYSREKSKEVRFCSAVDSSVWYYSQLNLRIGKEIGRGLRTFNEASFRLKLQQSGSEELDRGNLEFLYFLLEAELDRPDLEKIRNSKYYSMYYS